MYFDESCDATTATVVEICWHLSDIAEVTSRHGEADDRNDMETVYFDDI